MESGHGSLDARLEAAVERYIRQVTRRYVPIAVGVVALVLIAATLPSKTSDPSDTADVATSQGVAGSSDVPTGSESVIDLGGDATSTAATPEAGGATSGSQTASSPSAAPGAGAAAASAGAAPAAAGKARSGVTCGPGVLQVTWSKYAPTCRPVFSGDNGGATSRGVTATEITLVARKSSDFDSLSQTFGFTWEQYKAILQAWVDLFNRDYELYGRKVVLKTYNGQGSLVAEQADQGQAQAQADAQAEYDLGAFVAMGGSAIQQSAQSNKRIVNIGASFTPEKVMAQYDPYFYANTQWPSSDNWGVGAGQTACKRMNGMPAIFAGPEYQKTTRVWGLTSIEQANYRAGGEKFLSTSKQLCDLKVTQHSQYNYNYTDEPQQAQRIVAQMKAAGVTTLVHAGDPFMFFNLSTAAAQQGWNPEYLTVDPTDSFSRTTDQTQASRAIRLGAIGETPAYDEVEAAWKAAKGNAPAPSDMTWDELSSGYALVQQIFGALQGAGPNLTPATFKQGRQALPAAQGDFGLWHSTAQPGNVWNLVADFTLSKYDPRAPSKADNKPGTFRACNEAARYPFVNPDVGSGQLQC